MNDGQMMNDDQLEPEVCAGTAPKQKDLAFELMKWCSRSSVVKRCAQDRPDRERESFA